MISSVSHKSVNSHQLALKDEIMLRTPQKSGGKEHSSLRSSEQSRGEYFVTRPVLGQYLGNLSEWTNQRPEHRYRAEQGRILGNEME